MSVAQDKLFQNGRRFLKVVFWNEEWFAKKLFFYFQPSDVLRFRINIGTVNVLDISKDSLDGKGVGFTLQVKQNI
jgi:hypothetical protein